MLPDSRAHPVAGPEDFLLSAARRAESLYGYRPGTVEDYFETHRFDFTREDPVSAVDVQTWTFPMGGAADFEWWGIGCMGNDLGDFDNPAPPGPSTAPFLLADPASWFDLAFYSLGGTRAHQTKPVRGSLYRGQAGGDVAAPPGFPFVGRSFGLPFYFDEPTFISRNDSIRVDVTNWLNRSVRFPVASTSTFSVDVAIIGVRFYERRT